MAGRKASGWKPIVQYGRSPIIVLDVSFVLGGVALFRGLDCAVEVAVYQCLFPWLPPVFSYLQDALLRGTNEPVRTIDD